MLPHMLTGHGGLAAVIRAKIATGLLPGEAPSRMWAGPGSNNTCDACDQPITADQQEYECQPPGSRTIRVHWECLEAWRVARGDDVGQPRQTDAPHRDTTATRIAAILRDGSPAGYCIECLAARLGVPINEVRDAAQVLVARPGFRVVERECYTCGRVADDVLIVAGPLTPPMMDDTVARPASALMTEQARRVLAEIRQSPEQTACPPCLMSAVALDRWSLLDVIKQLVATGNALCSVATCPACQRRDLVLRPRGRQTADAAAAAPR